ncbi:helix-turn-helix transcriptional regulator [Bacillus sp. CGMCC 1.16607]|uniref:helix-turn-helix transcriptional regulator n=1 Tax=Bacillus sp. CGMCC 1.16607 TaxID=3351842 RepID=UPI0036427D1E
MNKDEIIEMVSENLRMIRMEAEYTQDKMAEIIGLSKKTLVQIEKGRVRAGWSTVVTVCALFRETEIVRLFLGNDPIEVLETIARDDIDFRKERTLGGKVWWRELDKKNGLILQQNIISKHFRILDDENYRIYSSFDEATSKLRFQELIKIDSK